MTAALHVHCGNMAQRRFAFGAGRAYRQCLKQIWCMLQASTGALHKTCHDVDVSRLASRLTYLPAGGELQPVSEDLAKIMDPSIEAKRAASAQMAWGTAPAAAASSEQPQPQSSAAPSISVPAPAAPAAAEAGAAPAAMSSPKKVCPEATLHLSQSRVNGRLMVTLCLHQLLAICHGGHCLPAQLPC